MELRRVNILLIPTTEQRQAFYDSVYYAQRMYNQAIDWCKETYKETGMFLSRFDMIYRIPEYRREHPEFQKVGSYVLQDAVTRVRVALNRMKRGSGFPRYKSYSKSRKSFGIYTVGVTLYSDKVKLPSIGMVKCKHCHWLTGNKSDEVLKGLKLHDARIYFDNKYWYLSVGVEVNLSEEPLTDEVIGIDFGVRKTVSTSNGVFEPNVNLSRQMKILERRRKILQKRISRKYLLNNHVKTKNIKRAEQQLRLICRKMKNIREANMHRVCNKIISYLPKRIMLEDLNVSGMMKNRYLSKSIAEQRFYKMRMLLIEKAKNSFIQVGVVPRFYPSSKLCHCCGFYFKNLGSSEIFDCPNCKTKIDRDFNASLNIRDCKEYELV